MILHYAFLHIIANYGIVAIYNNGGDAYNIVLYLHWNYCKID